MNKIPENKTDKKALIEKIFKFITEEFSKNLEEIPKKIRSLAESAYTPRTLEEFADIYVTSLDKSIVEKYKTNDLGYLGGDLKLYYIDEDYFGLVMSLYFQQEDKKYIKKKYEYKYNNRRELLAQEFDRLRTERTVAFEIEPPKVEADNIENEKDNTVSKE